MLLIHRIDAVASVNRFAATMLPAATASLPRRVPPQGTLRRHHNPARPPAGKVENDPHIDDRTHILAVRTVPANLLHESSG